MRLNPLRGEAELELGGDTFTLAATMEGLAELSRAAGCETLQDLYRRMIGTEILTTRAALGAFVQKGVVDGKDLKRRDAAAAAVAAFALSDSSAVQAAFLTILGALTRKPVDPDPDESGNRTADQG